MSFRQCQHRPQKSALWNDQMFLYANFHPFHLDSVLLKHILKARSQIRVSHRAEEDEWTVDIIVEHYEFFGPFLFPPGIKTCSAFPKPHVIGCNFLCAVVRNSDVWS